MARARIYNSRTAGGPPAPARAAAESALPPLGPAGEGHASLWEIVRISLGSLRANKMRSFLTMLGITIGVASVIALLAVGGGASSAISGSIESIGTNMLTLQPGSPTARGPGSFVAAQTLTLADAEAIVALGLPLAGVAPQYTNSVQIVAPAADQQALLVGTTPDFLVVNNLALQSGAFFDERQNRTASPVIVLGSSVARALFGSAGAIGQTVRVRNQSLTVIGVLAPKGGSPFGSIDDRAIIPLTVAYGRLFGGRTPDGNNYVVTAIQVAVIDPAHVAGVQERISLALRDHHGLAADGSEDDFRFFNQADLLGALASVTTVMTVFLGLVGGISLLVGGIGVMNIMLVSVTERTREIGLRKAVGARSRDILVQFLFEALAVSVIGGLLGVALAGGLALLVTLSGVIEAPVEPGAVLIALGFALLVGLFFGIYPARRAAQLNPIDALQSE